MGLIAEVYAFCFPDAAVKRALDRQRPCAIADLRDKRIAKIVGKVRPLEGTVRAPVSGKPCAAYKLRLDATVLADVGWLPVILVTTGLPFWVEDATGRALIAPEGVRASLGDQIDSFDQFTDQQIDIAERLLREHGIEFRGWLSRNNLLFHGNTRSPRSLRVREGIIEPGEHVAVSGRCTTEVLRDPSMVADYRELPTGFVFRAQGRVPLLISDDPRLLR